MPDDKIPVGFSNNDFFYKNVNMIGNYGIGTTNDLCSKDDTELRSIIENYLNDLSFNIPSQPNYASKGGQCTISESGVSGAENNWQLVYGKDANGNQTCTCKSASSVSNSAFADFKPYISSSTTSFELGEGGTPSKYYKCANSLPLDFTDNGASSVIDTNNIRNKKNDLVDKLINYYKANCINQELAKKLMQNNSQNANGEIQYQDAIHKYNREYLNRINLGIGIILTIGVIGYSFMSKSVKILLPTTTVPLPK